MTDIFNAENIKISVVVPCYNSQNYLNDCFKCLTSQTHSNFEAIFINDGSTDQTESIIQSFCEKDNRFKLFSTANMGVAKARNLGLAKAEGEYITFFDPDDIIFSTHLQNLLFTSLKYGADISICAFRRVKEQEAECFNEKNNEKDKVYDNIEGTTQLMSHRVFDVCLWNKLYKKELIKNNGVEFIDSRYGEDTYFNYACFYRAKTIAYSPKVTYHYVKRQNSLTHEKFSDNRLTVYNNLNAIVLDSEKNFAPAVNYAKYMRAAYGCEMLWFIAKYKYKKGENIKMIIDSMIGDKKFIRRCKKVAFYRRWLMPYVPLAAKIYFFTILRKLKKKEK